MQDHDDDGGGIGDLIVSSISPRKSGSRPSLDRGSSQDRSLSDRERERQPIYDGHRGYGSTASLDNFLSPKKINLTPTGKAFNSTVLVDPASCKIEHQIQRSDTLEGLAIKYGVTVEEIKRTNKLWSNNALFARKSIIVQLDPITYEKFNRADGSKSSDAEVRKERLEQKKAAAKEEFIAKTGCSEDSIADFYLEMFHYNAERAVRKFQIDIAAESHRSGSMEPSLVDSKLLLHEEDFFHLRQTSSPRSLPNGSSISNYSPYRPHDGHGGFQASSREQTCLEHYYYAARPSRHKGKEKDEISFSGEFEIHRETLREGDDPEIHHITQKQKEQLQNGYDKLFDL